jgi:glycosyltransferase involved in cell wall biosynthesis
MNKFTIVIPTLWKSDRTEKLLSDLNASEWVDEIIIIDNTLTHISDTTKDKIRTISFGENIYVNPAWNKGIELAKNNSIALLNDDINFNPNIFEVITEDVLNRFGIIGMGEGNYKTAKEEDEPVIEEWREGVNDWGWGCFIMLDKRDWVNIPDNIKIWYGDNFIKDVNPKPKAVLRNFKVETEMSTTSDEPIWDDRKREDQINFINCIRTPHNRC